MVPMIRAFFVPVWFVNILSGWKSEDKVFYALSF